MNYEQAKDQIAKKKGHLDFKCALIFSSKLQVSGIMNEAAELYADSVARDAWDRCYDAIVKKKMSIKDTVPKPEYQPK